jgi:hypothetical protein
MNFLGAECACAIFEKRATLAIMSSKNPKKKEELLTEKKFNLYEE